VPAWIDLRNETRALMRGDGRTKPQAFWAVLRIYRIGEYSQYWIPDLKEAQGGDKWNYDDHIIKCMDLPSSSILSMPRLRAAEATIVKAGHDDVTSSIFAIEYYDQFRIPNQADIMLHIDKHESRSEPRPPFTVTSRFDIVGTVPLFGDYGRIEIMLMFATRSHGVS
jgi:hypothetical protein